MGLHLRNRRGSDARDALADERLFGREVIVKRPMGQVRAFHDVTYSDT
jgi:hypothetical protein